MARGITNNGIGALYATFSIHQTDDEYDLSSEDLGKAVALSGNNEVSLGSAGGLLLGRLVHAQEGIATVQIGGVVRLSAVTAVPAVGDEVVVNGSGAVKKVGTGEPGRGIVLAVDTGEATCDVLL